MQIKAKQNLPGGGRAGIAASKTALKMCKNRAPALDFAFD